MPRKDFPRTKLQIRAKMLHDVLIVACHLNDELEALGATRVAKQVQDTIDELWEPLDTLLHPDEQCPE